MGPSDKCAVNDKTINGTSLPECTPSDETAPPMSDSQIKLRHYG